MISEKNDIDKEVLFDRMIKEISIINREIDKVIGDDEYILWIIDFLEKNEWCNNDDGIECLSFNKMENLEKLNYFRDGISRYARKNYIYPVNKNCRWSYYIEYNSSVYQLSWFEKIGRDVCYFDKVNDSLNINCIIKFDDVLSNRKSSNVDFIKNNLDLLFNYIDNVDSNLSLYVSELFDKGIPEEAIIDTTTNAFKRMLRRVKNNK